MTTLIVGATGATGKLLVAQLLESGNKVKIIVRSTANMPDDWNSNALLTIIKRDITEISVGELAGYLADCHAVASCLGHNLTWKGLFGKPRRLVTDSVKLIIEAILRNAPHKPMQLALMNTAGNSNRDLNEPVSIGERFVLGVMRLLLPPHLDNEKASDYLRVSIGQRHPYVEWVVVRPDTLIDEVNISSYVLHISPTTSAIFNPGKTSRINVGHFMSRLMIDEVVWNKWKGQMPVIYNEMDNYQT